MTEFGGPEVLQAGRAAGARARALGETLIRVTRCGLNFADTHTRTNSYVQKATLPLVPGGEVAGVEEETGRRVVALLASGGYAEYARRGEAARVRDPGRAGRRDGLGDDRSGDDRLAPLPHLRGGCAGGERRGTRCGGRRRLAGGPARPCARCRARDRNRLQRGEARADAAPRSRRRDRPEARGPDRAADRGQRGQPGRCRVRDGRRRGVRRLVQRACAVWADRRLRDRQPAAQRRLDGLAAAPLARGRRLLPVPLPDAPGRCSRTRSRSCSPAPRGGSSRRSSGTPIRSSRPPRRTSICASGAPRASFCSTPRLERRARKLPCADGLLICRPRALRVHPQGAQGRRV